MTTRGPERRSGRKRDNAELAALLLAVVLMALVTIYAHHQSVTLSHERVLLAGLETQIMRDTSELVETRRELGSTRQQVLDACERLQILRVQDNVSHYADWKVFRVVLLESRRATAASETRQQQQFQRAFLPQLAQAVHAKTWVPRTNCARAVARFGVHYRPPRPVPFSSRRPPRDALHVPTSYFK